MQNSSSTFSTDAEKSSFHETIDEEKFNAAIALLLAGAGEDAGRMFYEAGCRMWIGGYLSEWYVRTGVWPSDIYEQQNFWRPVRVAFESAGGLKRKS